MKRFLITIETLFFACAVFAQNDDLSRRIEVTRDYTPSAAKAEKLDIEPRMVDTVSLRPQVDYSITPTAWMSVYSPTPIAAVGVTGVKWEQPRRLFVELGTGVPLRSRANIYYAPVSHGNTDLGLYLNHDGTEAKIKNDHDVKRSALAIDNRVGGYVHSRFDRGGGMSFGMEYGMREYEPYGGFSYGGTEIDYGGRINYDDLRGRFVIGSDFENSSKLNVRLSVVGGYFSGKTKGVDGVQGQWDLDARLDVGLPLGRNPLLIGGGVKSYNGINALSERSRNSYEFSALYSLVDSGGLDFDLGARFIATESDYIVPVLKFDWRPSAWINPYVDIDGGVEDNSYRGLTYLNPYIADGVWPVDFDAHVDMKAGLKFNTSAADIDLHAGYDMHDEYQVFALLNNTSRFTAYGVKMKMFYAALNADVLLSSSFCVQFRARYNELVTSDEDDYDMMNLKRGTGIPRFTLGAWLNYEAGRLYLRGGAEVLGRREFVTAADLGYLGNIVSGGLTFVPSYVEGSVDVELEGRYEISDRLDVFIKGDNLLGQKIYLFNHYPSLGANVMMGVRVSL